MTQTCTFNFHHYISTEGEELFGRQLPQMLIWRAAEVQRVEKGQSVAKGTSLSNVYNSVTSDSLDEKPLRMYFTQPSLTH